MNSPAGYEAVRVGIFNCFNRAGHLPLFLICLCWYFFLCLLCLRKDCPLTVLLQPRGGIVGWSSTGKEYIQTIANKLYREMQDGEIYRT